MALIGAVVLTSASSRLSSVRSRCSVPSVAVCAPSLKAELAVFWTLHVLCVCVCGREREKERERER